MSEISAIILTKNEEENIVDCLESVLFCQEIIVIDDNSSDRTCELVEGYIKIYPKIKLFTRTLGTDFSAQRQFGIDKTKFDWVLFVDADERIPIELAHEIEENIEKKSDYGGYLIQRKDIMWGKMLMYGETGKIKLLRLFNKNHGKLIGTVHETWRTEKPVDRLQSYIIHYPHPTISEFLREINFYTDIRAQELFGNKIRANFISILLYPKAKFINNFIFKRGFMDGMPGLVHALIMSFHSFLVRGKLWLLWQKS